MCIVCVQCEEKIVLGFSCFSRSTTVFIMTSKRFWLASSYSHWWCRQPVISHQQQPETSQTLLTCNRRTFSCPFVLLLQNSLDAPLQGTTQLSSVQHIWRFKFHNDGLGYCVEWACELAKTNFWQICEAIRYDVTCPLSLWQSICVSWSHPSITSSSPHTVSPVQSSSAPTNSVKMHNDKNNSK